MFSKIYIENRKRKLQIEKNIFSNSSFCSSRGNLCELKTETTMARMFFNYI